MFYKYPEIDKLHIAKKFMNRNKVK